jgi:ComF family protein
MSWPYSLVQWWWGCIDWLYPPQCGGCNRPGYRWCPDCQDRVQTVSGSLCEVCGIPITGGTLCPSCREDRPAFRALRSWSVFEEPVRSALHRLKYRRNMGLGEALARPLADFAIRQGWKVDLVTPVPLGRKRLRERGYNQVALFAWPLAVFAGWTYAPGAVRRIRETRSQVGLSAEERRQNMQAAFRADVLQVKGKTVLVVDDVATTGATLSACAQAFLEAGAQEVVALTVARALPHHGLKIV